MIFYYAHPAALYVNKLRVSGLLSAPVDAYFETIFETGVDEMSWDDLSKNEMLWPAVSDVTAYRRKVYLLVRDLIRGGMQLPMPSPLDDAHPSWGLFMAIEHERIHIETSSVLIRELPLRLVRKPDAWPAYHPSALGAAPTDEPKPGVHFPAPSLVQVAVRACTLAPAPLALTLSPSPSRLAWWCWASRAAFPASAGTTSTEAARWRWASSKPPPRR